MEENELLEAGRRLFTKSFDGVIRIELLDDGGACWVDGRQSPPTVSIQSPNGVGHRFCLWQIDADDVGLVLTPDKGRFQNSYVAGRVRISGDMAIMARLELNS
ncbi:hypothetical protein [Parvularcula sp. LCG005]|uniref:hypothetical protein n=1 Tax=Parvularcula sp. LCG005 TaxID=3078805 RepID=UPI002942E8AF|nr:hypothetical protein [Parvularcula sp. LCG005]WOI52310.1 hypothetical protein RUI03_09115 [Parvularcula sp. LCG005]